MAEEFEGFSHKQTPAGEETTVLKECRSHACQNKLEEYDLHDKCVIHRRCISRSSLSYTPDKCKACQTLLEDEQGVFTEKMCDLIRVWRKMNGQEMVTDIRVRCTQRNYQIPLLSDEDIKEALKKRTLESSEDGRSELDDFESPPPPPKKRRVEREPRTILVPKRRTKNESIEDMITRKIDAAMENRSRNTHEVEDVESDNEKESLNLMKQATAPPPHKVAYSDESEPVQKRLYKCLKLWSMYADLEESLGTFKSTKAVYDRIIDLRIATPQIIINYGMFLQENNYYEEAFKAYEKGIALFKWPFVYDIWNTYLSRFLERYQGKKIERARDLFEQCLEKCPATYAKNLCLLYAKMEEDHGLARHAMQIYSRATKAVPPEEKSSIYNIYLQRAQQIYGVTKTRQIYEEAIVELPDEGGREMCQRFADLECKLGEVDRAREIYIYCSQLCDPRVTQEFWAKWSNFEVSHGNEDTMKELLRIKRSMQAKYNTQVNMMSAQMLQSANTVSGTVSDLAPGSQDGMRMLEAQAASKNKSVEGGSKISFVRGETSHREEEIAEASRTVNPEEISIDDIEEEEKDEEEEEEENDMPIQKEIPSEVFGGLKKTD